MKTAPPFPPTLAEIKAASHQLHQPGGGVGLLQTDFERMLLHEITNQPRSLQKRIGPSEIGTPCDHCLAAKLAGWQPTQQGIPWASTVGTAIHSLLEDFVWNHQLGQEPPYRYYTEQTVTVGQIGGQDITGSIDLLDVAVGATVDYKCVAKTSLQKYKREGPSQTYRVQAHLYAKGANAAGIKTDTVSICFLPRASNNFYERHWWSEPYNPQIAEDALARANQLHTNLTALETISTQTRDTWISGLPRAKGCWDCPRMPDAPQQTTIDANGVTFDLEDTTTK